MPKTMYFSFLPKNVQLLLKTMNDIILKNVLLPLFANLPQIYDVYNREMKPFFFLMIDAMPL